MKKAYAALLFSGKLFLALIEGLRFVVPFGIHQVGKAGFYAFIWAILRFMFDFFAPYFIPLYK